MKINLDIEKSIIKGSLEYEFRTWEDRFNHIIYFSLSAFFIWFLIIFLYFIQSDTSIYVVLILVPLAIFGICSTYTLLTYDRLIRVTGDTTQRNILIMQKIIERHFGRLPAESGKSLKYYRFPSFWRNGKRVIILFDNSDILINIASFNTRYIRSPLQGPLDRLKIYSIKNEILKEIQSPSA